MHMGARGDQGKKMMEEHKAVFFWTRYANYSKGLTVSWRRVADRSSP